MSAPPPMIDPPGAAELIRLVADFLATDLSGMLDDERIHFRVRVAANLLRIAEREIAAVATLEVDADGFAVPRGMTSKIGSVHALTEELKSGRTSITDPATFRLLRNYVDMKLAIVAPRHASDRHMSD